jgi:hypothetical protein
LMERGDPGLKFRIFCACGQDKANAPDPSRLLRPCCERPRAPEAVTPRRRRPEL